MPRLFSASVVFVLALVFAQAAYGQGYPQHSLWMNSTARLNPAASSHLYSLDFVGSFRKQWLDLTGAPTTTTASLAAPLYFMNSGVAFSYQRDEAGATGVTLLRGSFSRVLFQRDKLGLSLGAGASYRQASLNGTELRTETGVYTGGVFNHADAALPINEVSASGIGFDLGLELHFGESRVGLSVQDLNEPLTDWTTTNRSWPRTYLAYVTTVVPLAERVDLDAGLIAQSDATITQLQANALFWYDSNIAAGAAFRGYSANSIDAVSLLLAWRPSGSVTLAYAYDYGLSRLTDVHDGSHEIVLRYEMRDPIGKGKLPPVIFNPRL